MPHVTSIYLIKHSAFEYIKFDHKHFDPDMAMCESLRNSVSIRLNNVKSWILIDSSTFS